MPRTGVMSPQDTSNSRQNLELQASIRVKAGGADEN